MGDRLSQLSSRVRSLVTRSFKAASHGIFLLHKFRTRSSILSSSAIRLGLKSMLKLQVFVVLIFVLCELLYQEGLFLEVILNFLFIYGLQNAGVPSVVFFEQEVVEGSVFVMVVFLDHFLYDILANPHFLCTDSADNRV